MPSLNGLDYHGECRRAARAAAAATAGHDFFHFIQLDSRRIAVSLGEVPLDETCARLFHARVDGQAGELNYVNAGHPSVLLLRFQPQHVRRLESTGYREQTLPLQPGDLLLAVTDGITDAVNRKGERFTEAGVLEAVMRNPKAAAACMVREILRGLNRFTGNAPPADDRTVVAVRFYGQGEQPVLEDEAVEPVFAAA